MFSSSNLVESTPSLESSIHFIFRLVFYRYFNLFHFHSPIEVQPTKIILKEKRNALEPPFTMLRVSLQRNQTDEDTIVYENNYRLNRI